MGAETFTHIATGGTVQDAFTNARYEAAWDYGHAGYTGTIAEKDSFVVIPDAPSNPKEAEAFAYKMIADDDDLISDKWGSAGAIALGNNTWLFFGWASS